MDKVIITGHIKAAADADTQCCICNTTDHRARYAIKLVPNATSAANGTNYGSLRGYKGTGTSTPVCAARTTASDAITAYTPEDLAVTATGKDAELAPGEVLHFDLTHPGSGVAVDVQIQVTLTPIGTVLT